MNSRIIVPLESVGLADIALVGGKCASLGEMIRNLAGLGVRIPGGYVITTDAYRQFLEQSQLETFIKAELDRIDFNNVESLRRSGSKIRQAISNARFPHELSHQIIASYEACHRRRRPLVGHRRGPARRQFCRPAGNLSQRTRTGRPYRLRPKLFRFPFYRPRHQLPADLQLRHLQRGFIRLRPEDGPL